MKAAPKADAVAEESFVASSRDTSSLTPLLGWLDVRDYTFAAGDLETTEGRLKVLGLLVGEGISLPCDMGERGRCASVSLVTRCGACVALEQLEQIKPEWTYGTLNQALLLLRQPPLSEGYFASFFGQANAELTNAELACAIARCRAFAMLGFGGIRYGFKKLAELSAEGIRRALRSWGIHPQEKIDAFKARPHERTLITPIADDDRWLTGYLSSSQLDNDRKRLDILLAQEAGRSLPTQSESDKRLAENLDKERPRWRPLLGTLLSDLEGLNDRMGNARAAGIANTAAYLAASHIDVYVATSMRERREFLAAQEMIREVFGDPRLMDFNVTYFDPTLSFLGSRIDKGLVEGLMLRRALCTLYMVQEVDTLGKDSELAATLAMGKPVIAYVPGDDEETLRRFLEKASLELLRKRILLLYADNRVKAEDHEAVSRALEALLTYAPTFALVGPRDEEDEFRRTHDSELCNLFPALARAEKVSYDKRASTLKSDHPLGMQLEQETGVANGVLVARTYKECADLIYGALTGQFGFDIRYESADVRVKRETNVETVRRNVSVLLAERDTGSPYRVVTTDEMLTNAFWARYGAVNPCSRHECGSQFG